MPTPRCSGHREAVPARPDHQRGALQRGHRGLDADQGRGHQRRGQGARPVRSDHDDGPVGGEGKHPADLADVRHARPDGRPVGWHHRAADPFVLPRGALGARVLPLDARRAEGSGRHRDPNVGLGLPDAAPDRRVAERHRLRRGLRHRGRHLDRGPDRSAAAAEPPRPACRAGTWRPRSSIRTRAWSWSSSTRAARSSPRTSGTRSPASKVPRVHVRSPLLCESRHGVCQPLLRLAPGHAAPSSRSATRSGSWPRSRSASLARSSRCGRSTRVVWRACAWTPAEDGQQVATRAAGRPQYMDITSGLPRVEELFEARDPEGQRDPERDRRRRRGAEPRRRPDHQGRLARGLPRRARPARPATSRWSRSATGSR